MHVSHLNLSTRAWPFVVLQVVALHSRGVPKQSSAGPEQAILKSGDLVPIQQLNSGELRTTDVIWEANLGVRISAIATAIAKSAQGGSSQLMVDFLQDVQRGGAPINAGNAGAMTGAAAPMKTYVDGGLRIDRAYGQPGRTHGYPGRSGLPAQNGAGPMPAVRRLLHQPLPAVDGGLIEADTDFERGGKKKGSGRRSAGGAANGARANKRSRPSASRLGFDPDFLGMRVNLPRLGPGALAVGRPAILDIGAWG